MSVYDLGVSDYEFIHPIMSVFYLPIGHSKTVMLLDDLSEDICAVNVSYWRDGITGRIWPLAVPDSYKDKFKTYPRYCFTVIESFYDRKRLVLASPHLCATIIKILNKTVGSVWTAERLGNISPVHGYWHFDHISSTSQKPFDYEREIKISTPGLSPTERLAYLTKED